MNPQRTTFFKVVGHESEPLGDFILVSVITDTPGVVTAGIGSQFITPSTVDFEF